MKGIKNVYPIAKLVLMQKKDSGMKFYDASRPLFPETDASGVSLRTRLLHISEGMNCGCDEVPDNANMCPIACASKGLLSTE